MIKILDEKTINKIAAGEVIERPASVIKELIENSIDAKATEIIIEVRNLGKDLIKIKDNGVGMNKEDLKLSFQRYATSKIENESFCFEIIIKFETTAIDANASPLKPNVCILNKSSSFSIFEGAYL